MRMAGTMKKEDVKLSYDDLDGIDWTEVRNTAGQAVPQLAKNVVKDLLKQQKNKEIKKPYAKVGLIGADLYLRFKDGNSHLDDVLLVKGWTQPGQAPVRDRAYQKLVDDFIEDRQEMATAVKDGGQIVKHLGMQIETLLGQMKDLVKLAETGAKKGQPDMTAIPAAGKIATAATRLYNQAKDQFDNRIHPPFDTHRTITKPDGVDAIDVSDWGKSWYIQTVNPMYQKAKEALSLAETTLEQITDGKSAVDRFTLQGDKQAENYLAAAQKIKVLVEKELASAKGIFKMAPIDNFEYGLSQDLKNIKERFEAGNNEVAQRTVDNAAGKAANATGNFKSLRKHLDKLYSLSDGVDKIPKDVRKTGAVKTTCEEISDLVREAKSYDKEVQGQLKAGLKVMEQIKKLVS